MAPTFALIPVALSAVIRRADVAEPLGADCGDSEDWRGVSMPVSAIVSTTANTTTGSSQRAKERNLTFLPFGALSRYWNYAWPGRARERATKRGRDSCLSPEYAPKRLASAGAMTQR